MSRHVTSTGGDNVEVLDDLQLATRMGIDLDAGRHLAQMFSWTRLRPAVITTLWQHGPYENRSGRAAGLLASDAGLDIRQVSPVLASPAGELLVGRETNGKRTYRIQLVAVAQRWLPYLTTSSTTTPVAGDASEVVDASPALPELPPSPVSVGLVPQIDIDQPVTELEVAHAVATSLLTQVVEIIVAGRADAHDLERLRRDIGDAAQRLSAQIEDGQQLRRRLSILGDELRAVKDERDGLRQRLRAAEHNLHVATSGDVQRVIDAEVRKRLDSLMRQAPGDLRSRSA